MNRKLLTIMAIMMMIPFSLFGESYDALWKQVQVAGDKDLPKTELDVLSKIVRKAKQQHEYGQLLKAELKSAQVSTEISPDSLAPAVDRLKASAEETNDVALKAVYYAVLGRIFHDNSELADDAEALSRHYYELAMEHPEELARVKAGKYRPLVTIGADSRIFGDDLLSLIGMWTNDNKTMHQYYDAAGNRSAACLLALKILTENRPYSQSYADSEYLAEADSIIDRYQDLAEVGEVVLERFKYMNRHTDATAEQKVAYIDQALSRWGTWKRMGELRNARKELTESQFTASIPLRVMTSREQQVVTLKQLRNLSELQLNIYSIDADGTLRLDPSNDKDYRQLKQMMHLMPELTQKRSYTQFRDFDIHEDSLTIGPLKTGVYMVEVVGTPTMRPSRRLLYVSDVRLLSEPLPGRKNRLVVVDATTGHPIVGAHVDIDVYLDYRRQATRKLNLTSSQDGECEMQLKEKETIKQLFVYTNDDKTRPATSGDLGAYHFRASSDEDFVELYTDRSIYRPGQIVHAAAIMYGVTESIRQQAKKNTMLTFELHDANYNLISEQQVITDEYGTAAADFTLPTKGLTGDFTLRVGQGGVISFRVEEYKRPTFEASFETVNQPYEAGDTVHVKAMARSYAGVPVQGGKVSWRVVRQRAWWWWRFSSYYETGVLGRSNSEITIAEGETTTEADGGFAVDVPMTIPETEAPTFYTFLVTADVTDAGGETHRCETSLNLGNRKTAFGCTLADQVLIDEEPELTFTRYNGSGHPIDGQVTYRIDGGNWEQAKANEVMKLPRLNSGSHLLEASCGDDELERKFTVFSLDDQRPATETDDWFYQSASSFPSDGKPVTIQTGSSDSDVYIIYNVFSADRILESGHTTKTNELINRKLTWREEYGDAVLLTYAWVKNGRMYHHTATIMRPLPDKELKMEWKTFRDRLKPGQQEEWTLQVKMPPSAATKRVSAQLMATLYDYSLDQIYPHSWTLQPRVRLTSPSTNWHFASWGSLSLSAYRAISREDVKELEFSTFDESLFPNMFNYRHRLVYDVMSETMMVGAAAPVAQKRRVGRGLLNSVAAADEMVETEEAKAVDTNAMGKEETVVQQEPVPEGEVQLRENLQETAFFYPRIASDANGLMTLKFTLPESLTTWRFMGIAHTADMYHGLLTDKVIAQKDVMVQPNMPRFVREGDEATVTARLFNNSSRAVSGKACMELLDPETEKVVYTNTQSFSLQPNASDVVTFAVESNRLDAQTMCLLICRITATGKGFSDGEQHYLPVLPSRERVTVSRPFTQNEPGTTLIDLTTMVPADATGGELTVEYTNNPAWLIVQALPVMGTPADDNAISQAASYYANSLGRHILGQIPNAHRTFELWQQERDDETSLTGNLEKNQELKDILLCETPWVMEAKNETEQKHRLADFFDTNRMDHCMASAVEKLQKLQLADGSWTWWEGMPGSFWITVEIAEMLVRLHAMTGTQDATQDMLNQAFSFLQSEMAKEVARLKELEKKGHEVNFPSYKALQYLYICTLDGRKLPAKAERDNEYLVKLLRKEIKQQDLYDKAVTAIILDRYDHKTSLEYVQSLKEYTVYNEEKGRYFDSRRAAYSWKDYRIPTQVATIEAIGRLTPDDQQTLQEMQRWLLQEKRTTCWDTPVNSVNAVYAFLSGNKSAFAPQERTKLSIDDRPLELPQATAGLGYVKTTTPAAGAKTFKAEKTSVGVSWGAVYAQFMQPTSHIADSGSGMSVKRELYVSRNGEWQPVEGPLKVGERIKVRIVIEAERDYDFVQVLDRRGACMEPVRQLSGYNGWAYCTPKDYSTNYYFDLLAKGKRIVETEYYIDRAGTYETGTCTVECAYAPEYRAKAKSVTIKVEE